MIEFARDIVHLLRELTDAALPTPRFDAAQRLAGTSSQSSTPLQFGFYTIHVGAENVRISTNSGDTAKTTDAILAAYSQTPMVVKHGDRVSVIHEDGQTAFEVHVVPSSRKAGRAL